jgi:glycosyltransferase involved in cell wall biosynthesis
VVRVLHVVPGLAARGGGVAAVVVDLALGLEEHGVETTVFTTDLAGPAHASPRRPVRADELPAGAERIDVRRFPSIPPRRLAPSPTLARALRRDVRSFDLVHIHSLWLHPQFAAYRAARRHRIPYVVSPHGMLDPYLRARSRGRKALAHVAWQRRMLERAALIHFTAEDEARLAADIAPSVPRRVVGNPIAWDAFQRLPDDTSFRRERLDGHEGPVVLSLGRITRKKGLDVLVRAFAHVVLERPTTLLAIVGPDDDGLRPELEAVARAQGVGDRVVFPGVVSGDDRLGAFAVADVFVLPSHSENFGVAVAEALAAGVATVISPDVNIAPELARAGAAVVADARPDALASALLALLSDESRRRDLGAAGRLFARRYDRAVVAGRFRAAYESCLGLEPTRLALEAARA